MNYALLDCDGKEFTLFGEHGLVQAERAATGKPATEAFLNTGRATAFEAKTMRGELAEDVNGPLASLRHALARARGGIRMTGGVLVE